MALAELTEQCLAATQAATEEAGQVRLGIHDASRLEWSLSVPLPSSGVLDYSLRVELQIPRNAFVSQVPWDQMQAFTRLDGPALAVGDAVTIDALRRGALAMASQLARASEGFTRHCRLAESNQLGTSIDEIEEALTVWIEAAERISQEARERLVRDAPVDTPDLTRERELVDEYVSVRLLEALAGAERALRFVTNAQLVETVAKIEERLAGALEAELVHRKKRGFDAVDAASSRALERYLERSSRLKKHFQEVLFLESESFKVADRAYHWIAGFVAVVASTWAFAWQIALANKAGSVETVSSGIITLALVAGVVYATKDRMKEIGRVWMTTRVHRVWGAQRITRYRAPARRVPTRDVVVTARESFDESVVALPDPLNPESGATVPVTVLSYAHKGQVMPNDPLLASGVRRVKHVFRYDLSKMFARLDDAMKPVPVLDAKSHKVRFVDALRCYRLPVRVVATCGSERYVESGALILHKRGLERLERDGDAFVSVGTVGDVGFEPG